MWQVIEHYSRTDEHGYEHYIRPSDDKKGFELEINGRSGPGDFKTVDEAREASLKWSEDHAAKLAAEAAEAAKWPKKATKTMRRWSWNEKELVKLDLVKQQPTNYGTQEVEVYLDGELLGTTRSSEFYDVKSWQVALPGEKRVERFRHRITYESQAEAIRKLLREHEDRKSRETLKLARSRKS